MNYVLFLLKKTFKNKIIYIPIILFLALAMGMLYLNSQEINKNNLLSQTQESLSLDKIALEKEKYYFEKTNLPKEDQEAARLNIEMYESNISSEQDTIKNIERNNWEKAYEAMLKPLATNIKEIESQNAHFSELESNYIKHNFLMFSALKERNIAYEDSSYPTKGINYALFVMQILSPVFLFITVIFILSMLFTEPYHNKIDSQMNLPIGENKAIILNMFSGIIISAIIVISYLLIPFILGSIFFGTGKTNYPILSYDLSNNEMYFQNISKIFIPSLLLEILSCAFISILVYLVAHIFKDKLATLFISLIIIIGLLLSVNVMEPLQRVAQYLPTTYMNSVSVVTGEYGHEINNLSISLNQGIYILVTSIIVLLTLTVLVKHLNTINFKRENKTIS